MISDKEKIINLLDKNNIKYNIVEHDAVFTIEETNKLELESRNSIVKNLFLREDKKQRFFLLMLKNNKKANLKELRQKLNSRPLSFAQENYLNEHLKLSAGSVSPFGIINDDLNIVEVVVDKDLSDDEVVGVHPNENTSTIFLNINDLKAIIEEQGNKFIFLNI